MTNDDLPLEDERTDSVSRLVPDYADAEMRNLGERLAVLYEQRDTDPDANVAEEIERIRFKMRKGPRLQAGEFLQNGRYRLIRRLARGRGDAYWTAVDRAQSALVLVRVIHSEWVDDPQAVGAFIQRGDALERLSHPGIGGVLDADRTDDGFVYLATKFFPAGDLTQARLDATDAMQVVFEIAQALRYAHEQGVVHEDVRPHNVLLSRDGAAHVVGFSVDPELPSDASLFRAPETTESRYKAAPPADVYALGMTALYLLNGNALPFWVIREPGRLIRSLTVLESVKSALSRATDWDLSVRYPSMQALLDDLMLDPELVGALADRAREKGRYSVAAEHFETLLTIQPRRSVEIRIILADVYVEMEAYDKALAHLISALERTTDVEGLFPRLRHVAGQTGEWAKVAEALWTQARARDAGRRVVLRMELARVNQDELHNPVAAAETWSQVLLDHRTPEQAEIALRALRDLANLRQDWVGFVEYGQELLEYAPAEERHQIEHSIGRACLEHLGDEVRGLEFIDRADAGGYCETDLFPRLQSIRARRGQWRQVIQLMIRQAAAQEISEASPTLLRAGIIASSVHLEEEAFSVYHALLDRAPKHVVALRHVARMHHRAHEHDKALRYYERLWETYRGRDAEEPEASERAADCIANALLLLKAGRADDAVERLTHALKMNPNHVPSLQLAGPLYLARGEVGQAGVVFDRLLSLFKSVELSSHKIEACLGMGDLAWTQGRLTAAMGWYNRALELDPFSVAGWWGLAKVGLASRGGHPGAERAPWVMAMPKRYTAYEALARLFAGLLDPATMRSWLSFTPLGRAMTEGGDSAMRLACAVVDVLARNELINPDLFQQLLTAYPTWYTEICLVRDLWLGGTAATFPVVRTYGWSGRLVEVDFDPEEQRAVLPPDLIAPSVTSGLTSLAGAPSLFEGARPEPPAPYTHPSLASEKTGPRFQGPVGALLRDGVCLVALRRDQLSITIGSGEDTALQLPQDASIQREHARLFRQCGRIYVELATPGAKLQVDGESRERWRLVGGERVTIGETRLQYQAFEDESRLPESARPAPAPAPVAPAQSLSAQAGQGPASLGGQPAPAVTRAAQPGQGLPVASRPEAIRSPLAPSSAGTDEVAYAAPDTARLLEPTSAMRIADFRDNDEPDDPDPHAVALDRVAVAVSEDPVRDRVALQATHTDLEPGTDPEASVETARQDHPGRHEPAEAAQAANGAPAAPVAGFVIDEDSRDDLEDQEVIQSPPRAGPGGPGPDPVTQKLIRVMDDGSVDTGPIPPDQLREALGLPPLDASEQVTTVWLRDAIKTDEDDEDDEEEDDDEHTNGGVPNDTTMMRPITPPFGTPPNALAGANPQADNGAAEAPSPALFAPPMPPPQSAPVEPAPKSIFGFPGEVMDDDVSKLQSEPPKLGRGVSGPPSQTPAPIQRVPPLPRTTSPTPDKALAPDKAVPPSKPPSLPPATMAGQGQASLEFMSGPERGRRIEVGDSITVGQSRQCGVSIPGDVRLSAVHCKVERTREGFVLTDQGSANGTVVNGQRVSRFALNGGEVIMVGRTVLRFRLEGV